MIRTLVCASSGSARAALAALVRDDARLQYAGEASPAELERSIARDAADVVLEERDGEGSGVRFPTVSLVDDPRQAWADAAYALEPGPRAILARDASSREIVAAIVAVAAGLVALAPRALVPVFAVDAAGEERLTARELDVLGELARGASNKVIAQRLAISEHTVKFHIASVFEKLGAASRTEAVTHGIRRGLIML